MPMKLVSMLLVLCVNLEALADDREALVEREAQALVQTTGQGLNDLRGAIRCRDWCLAHPNGGTLVTAQGTVNFSKARRDQQLQTSLAMLSSRQVKTMPQGAQVHAAPVRGGGGVLQTSIDGEFSGFEHEKLFKLMNGQVWQQSEFFIHLHYAYGPRVMLYQEAGGTMMKVDGVEKAVRVMQVR